MNKKLMLLGLCLMGVFSSLHADESGEAAKETAAVTSETSITTPSEKEEKIEQTNEDCGCNKKKG